MASNAPFRYNSFAPEVYADACFGVGRSFDNIKISFSSFQHNQDPENMGAEHVLIGRLVMPLPAAVAMAKTILEFAENQPVLSAKAETETFQ